MDQNGKETGAQDRDRVPVRRPGTIGSAWWLFVDTVVVPINSLIVKNTQHIKHLK